MIRTEFSEKLQKKNQIIENISQIWQKKLGLANPYLGSFLLPLRTEARGSIHRSANVLVETLGLRLEAREVAVEELHLA